MTIERIAIIGPGRVGLSLARALVRSGRAVAVLGRHAAALPEPLEPATTLWSPAIASADLVVIAVPDSAIAEVALELARGGAITDQHVILHTSGLHDRTELAALNSSGAALGSWHPLQTISRPSGEPEGLAGSPAILEGDPRAVATGRELADMLHMRPALEIAADRKASYHAAAVFASNYVVVLADVATRLARDAAGDAVDVRLFLPIIRRTVAHLAGGTAAALTGPIRRGDTGTVEQHLAALEGTERALYLALAKEALRLAEEAGLAGSRARAIEQLLY